MSNCVLQSSNWTLVSLSLPSWSPTIPSPRVDIPGGPGAVLIAGGAIGVETTGGAFGVEPTEVADAEMTVGNPPTGPGSISLRSKP